MNASFLPWTSLVLLLLTGAVGTVHAQTAGRVDTCAEVLAEPVSHKVLLVLGDAAVGQSGSEPARSRDGVYNLNPINGLCYPARDPMVGTLGSETAPWVRLGHRLHPPGARERVLIAPLITRRSELAEWLPDGPLFLRLEQLLHALHRQGLRPHAVLWQHGGGAGDETAGDAVYRQGIETLIAALRQRGIDAPFLLAASGQCPGTDSGSSYAAQRALHTHPDIHPGPDLAALGGAEKADCGLDEEGMQALVDAWFTALDQAGVLAEAPPQSQPDPPQQQTPL